MCPCGKLWIFVCTYIKQNRVSKKKKIFIYKIFNIVRIFFINWFFVGAVVIEHFHLFSSVLASKIYIHILYIYIWIWCEWGGQGVFIPMKLIFHMRYVFTNKCATALLQALLLKNDWMFFYIKKSTQRWSGAKNLMFIF